MKLSIAVNDGRARTAIEAVGGSIVGRDVTIPDEAITNYEVGVVKHTSPGGKYWSNHNRIILSTGVKLLEEHSETGDYLEVDRWLKGQPAETMVDLHVNLTVLERGQEVERVLRFFSALGLKGLTEDDNGMLSVMQALWEAIDSFQMEDAFLPRFCYPNAWDMKPGDGSEPSAEMAAAIAALPRLER